MLYNLYANDPELYTTTKSSLGNNILNRIQEETGILIDKLLDNSGYLLKEFASGNFVNVSTKLTDIIKE